MQNSSPFSIQKMCTFPDGSSFPIHSIFDVGDGYFQVCYFDEGLPQVVWVPSDFVAPIQPDLKNASPAGESPSEG
jgi:hypothetical protein